MISVNIAFDNRDAELGEFFRQCKDDLITFLNDNDASDEYDVHEMHSGLCNMAYLDNRMPLINANNFLFIAYSHGEDNCLLAGGTAYIDSNHYSNVHLFTNSFFYSVACFTGARLGGHLINSGSHTFIGYRDSYQVLDRYMAVAIECANLGIKMFFTGRNVEEAFRLMKQLYTQKVDRLIALGDPLGASFLRENRDGLVQLGRRDLTAADFEV